MRILITGNPNVGLAQSLSILYPDATFICRNTGYDLTTTKGQEACADLVLDSDVFINNSALWKFNQTVLLDIVYKKCVENKHRPQIIAVGSTTDRVKNGKVWLYNAEKKALRDYCNTLALNGVWGDGPKITLISFGSLSNVKHKHPDRTCLDLEQAATSIKWIIDQPKHICINEISIDPIQVPHE
jgi:NADP-dependent 3-hydroxy acid dehydrogenase YdfG